MKKTMEMLNILSYTLLGGLCAGLSTCIAIGSYTVICHTAEAIKNSFAIKYKAIHGAIKKIKDKKQDQTEKEKIEVEVIQ